MRRIRPTGLRSGDHVAMLLENRSEMLVTAWAAHRLGLHYTPINWHLQAGETAPLYHAAPSADWWGPVIHEFYGCSEGIGFARIGPQEWLAHKGCFKCPRSVDFVDELPRLPTGKLLKRQLRQRYWPAAQP